MSGMNGCIDDGFGGNARPTSAAPPAEPKSEPEVDVVAVFEGYLETIKGIDAERLKHYREIIELIGTLRENFKKKIPGSKRLVQDAQDFLVKLEKILGLFSEVIEIDEGIEKARAEITLDMANLIALDVLDSPDAKLHDKLRRLTELLRERGFRFSSNGLSGNKIVASLL